MVEGTSLVAQWFKKSESEVAQLCPTLCDPMKPTRILRPWDFPGKSTRVGCHFLLQVIKKKKKKSAYKCRRHWFDPWIKEIPLEKGMATHSSILAWKSLGQRSPVCCSPRGRKELDETEGLGGRSSKILPWRLVRSSAKWMRFKHLSQTEEISMTVAQEVSFALNLV